MTTDHFKGKSVIEHLKEARSKGSFASSEIHGVEMSGQKSAATNAAKETALILLLFCIVAPSSNIVPLLLFSPGWVIWKTGRSALLGWSSLERFHRAVEEEQWEIQNNREQEKEELKSLYAAKGLKDKLLDDVISVLMADDNRLLQVMLDEELGIKTGGCQHPLKQASGAFYGSFVTAIIFTTCYNLLSLQGAFAASMLVTALSSYFAAKEQKNRLVEAVVWNVSCFAFAAGTTFFLSKWMGL